ncbi:MAG: (2Fe-2S)-binding protein [Bdellovibrionaceae bacterium]|nr:(2Fe-2S)-binding protein [Pseudobdellovibrionaceae bacterium]
MTIYFSPNKPQLKPIEVSAEDSKNKTLMTLLLDAKYPVASSCKGDGICSKCRVTILNGSVNLSPQNDLEIKTKLRNNVAGPERLSCQVHIQGDITIDTNYW